MINPSTKLSLSPKKFDLKKISKMIEGGVSVCDVMSKSAYDKVTIRAKVLRVQLPVDVAPGLKKQEVTVADSTGAIKITLWESNIDAVKEEMFKNFTVRTFKHEKYLSMPKEGGEIMKIEDMGCVAPDDLPDDITTLSKVKIEGARVMAYSSCVACKSKVETTAEESISKCTKCELDQFTIFLHSK